MNRIPEEVAIKILESTSSLDEMVRIKDIFNISTQGINEAILEECTKGVKHLSPIEQLYILKQPRYVLSWCNPDMYGGYTIEMVGTKEEIIEKMVDRYSYVITHGGEEATGTIEEAYEYYNSHFVVHVFNTDTPDIIYPFDDIQVIRREVLEIRKIGYKIYGPI